MASLTKRYRNAAGILPKAVLAQVQEYAAGLTLYIPYPVRRQDVTRLKVLDLRMQGYSLTQIARRVGCTKQNVLRILKVDRQRALALLALCTDAADATPGETAGGSEPGESARSPKTGDGRTEATP